MNEWCSDCTSNFHRNSTIESRKLCNNGTEKIKYFGFLKRALLQV